MISRLLFRVIVLLWAGTGFATAETVSVGRASIDLPEGAWKVLSAGEGKTLLNGGISGSLTMDNQAFVLTSGNELKALLYISSSKSGSGISTNWSNTCNGTQRTYALSLTSNPNALECGKATGALKTDVYLKLAMPEALAALEVQHLVLPAFVQSTSATVGNSNGSNLHVNLIAVPAFAGLQSAENLTVPPSVKAAHAAWARELTTAVKDSVYSMSGKMTVPAVTFAATSVTTSTPK
ncbi:MAG: hypothetical protein V4772_10485 [Pseudomonadota bacterium]